MEDIEIIKIKEKTNQKLRERLQKVSMKELAKIHTLLGLDEKYPYSDYKCKGDYIMHIFEKDERTILNALKDSSKKKPKP